MQLVIDGKVIHANLTNPKLGNCRIMFRVDGRVHTVNTGVRKSSDVPKPLIDKLVRAWFVKYLVPVVHPPAGTPYRTAMEAHLRESHSHNSPGTIKGRRYELEKLGAVLNWPMVESITKEVFREAIPKLMVGKHTRKIAAHTWSNELGEYSHFANWLVDEDIIVKEFTRGVKKPGRAEFGRREEIFDEAWFKPIRDELPHEWREPWEDVWFTGMDSGDLFEFRPRRHLVISANVPKIWKRRKKQKNSSSLMINQPLDIKLRTRWLAKYETAKRDEPLYENVKRFESAKTWGNTFLKAVHDAQTVLKLPLLDIKTTRHTFTTRHVLRLVRAEKNAPSLMEIRAYLGHAPDSRMVELVYARLASRPEAMAY